MRPDGRAEAVAEDGRVVLDVADVVHLVFELGDRFVPGKAALRSVEVQPIHAGIYHRVAHRPLTEYLGLRIPIADLSAVLWRPG